MKKESQDIHLLGSGIHDSIVNRLDPKELAPQNEADTDTRERHYSIGEPRNELDRYPAPPTFINRVYIHQPIVDTTAAGYSQKLLDTNI